MLRGHGMVCIAAPRFVSSGEHAREPVHGERTLTLKTETLMKDTMTGNDLVIGKEALMVGCCCLLKIQLQG